MSFDVKEIPLDHVHPNPWNTRLFTDEQRLNELAASIREHGVLEPVLVRPHPDKKAHYQLLAGERRYRASLLAEKKTIFASIHEVDDDGAFKLTVVENLQRKDLHPLEESAAYVQARGRGWGLEQIAAEFGVPLTTVARRERLSCLSSAWRAAIANPKMVLREWPVGHLEYIARFDAEQQDVLLKEFNDDYHHFIPTHKEIKELVSRAMRTLDGAAWSLDDENLCAKAGACATCKKRSDVQPELFDADEISVGKKAKPTVQCLDSGCWERKAKAYLERKVIATKAVHPELLLIGGQVSAGGLKGRWAHELESVKKGDKDAVPAIVGANRTGGDFSGKAVGQLVWVRVRQESFSPNREKKKKAEMSPEERLEDGQARLHARRMAYVFEVIDEQLKNLEQQLAVPPWLEHNDQLRVAVAYGGRGHFCRLPVSVDSPDLYPEACAWSLCQWGINGLRRILGDNKARGDYDLGEHAAALRLLRISKKEIENDAEREIPTPKALVKLEKAVGTEEKKSAKKASAKKPAKAKKAAQATQEDDDEDMYWSEGDEG